MACPWGSWASPGFKLVHCESKTNTVGSVQGTGSQLHRCGCGFTLEVEVEIHS